MLAAVHTADLGDAVSIAVPVAGFVLPALFTARSPERVRARMAGTAPATPLPLCVDHQET